MSSILLVSDDPEVGPAVSHSLRGVGHDVDIARDGIRGLLAASRGRPDLVVLDLALPGLGARAFLTAVALDQQEMPVVVISSDSDVQTRRDVFAAGATDFVPRPFTPLELVARIDARLVLHHAAPGAVREAVLRVGVLALHLAERVVVVHGRTVDLPTREFQLLHHLALHAGTLCTRRELLAGVWGFDFDPAADVLGTCVARLRQRVPGIGLRSVGRVGYVLLPGRSQTPSVLSVPPQRTASEARRPPGGRPPGGAA